MSSHGHPSPQERHDAAALERVLAHRDERAREAEERAARAEREAEEKVAILAERESHVRAAERERITGVLLCDGSVRDSDFEGCVD